MGSESGNDERQSIDRLRRFLQVNKLNSRMLLAWDVFLPTSPGPRGSVNSNHIKGMFACQLNLTCNNSGTGVRRVADTVVL